MVFDRVVMMKKVCWVGMVERGENTGLTMGERLFATLALLRWITSEYQELQREHLRLQRLSAELSKTYLTHEYTPNHRRAGTANTVNGDRLSTKVPDASWEEQSAELRNQSVKHGERLTSWRESCFEFRKLRTAFEKHNHKPLNYWQTQVYSILNVSVHDDKWDGCLNRVDTIESINGNLLISDWYKNPLLWKRYGLDRKGAKQGKRVSIVHGVELTKFHVIPNTTDTRSRFARVMGRLDVLKTIHPAVMKYTRLCPAYGDSNNPQYGPNSTIFRGMLETFRYCQNAGLTPDNVASLRRLSEVSSGLRSSVLGVVVSRPENLGDCFIAYNGEQYALNIIRWKFFALQGGEYSEYAVSRQSVQALPTEFLRQVVSSVQTYHNDESDASSGMLTLADRIRRSVIESARREEQFLKNAAFAQQQKQEQRRKQANILRTLRKVDTVSVQDSFKVGNCKPGTLQFMNRIGLPSDTVQIPGRELARLWKVAGKPHEPLFFRMVDTLGCSLNGGVN